jgi:hypothetical protein
MSTIESLIDAVEGDEHSGQLGSVIFRTASSNPTGGFVFILSGTRESSRVGEVSVENTARPGFEADAEEMVGVIVLEGQRSPNRAEWNRAHADALATTVQASAPAADWQICCTEGG